MKLKLPYGEAPSTSLDYMAVEISYGSRWVNINDNEKYQISSDGTRDSTTKSWRKTVADSPILGGNYLVHAVPDMVNEQVTVRVSGDSQTDLADNYFTLIELFEQIDYRVRWTFNEYREYWRCQLADAVMSRNQVWTHNQLAVVSFTVPRYPDVTRERV